jgi:MinD-like ATPase involved in chromosome partitioning or flagellar assembly
LKHRPDSTDILDDEGVNGILTGILVTCDQPLADHLVALARDTGSLEFGRVIVRQVQNYELLRVVNGFETDVVFLDFADLEIASGQAKLLAAQAPHAARIGFHSEVAGGPEQNPLPDLVDAWLSLPSEPKQWNDTLWSALHRPQKTLAKSLFAFLPAKAGCGSTTVAIHIADHYANELGRQTVLFDADLLSGLSTILLNVEPKFSLRDVLAQSAQIQPVFWTAAVQSVGRLHILCTKLDQSGPLPHWTDYWKLLRFASSRYDTIIVDLPERINDATVALVAEAEKVLIVTTPELPALRLARRRLLELSERGIPKDRTRIVLNRWHRGDLAAKEVEEFLGVAVIDVLPNDYKAVQSALQSAGFVKPDSNLGRAFGQLAAHLAGIRVRDDGAVRRSFFSKFRG